MVVILIHFSRKHNSKNYLLCFTFILFFLLCTLPFLYKVNFKTKISLQQTKYVNAIHVFHK